MTKGADSLILTGEAHGHHARRCGKCFSLLYWTGYEGKIRVPYGSLIDEPELKPMAHMFVGSKAPWFEITDDLRVSGEVLRDVPLPADARLAVILREGRTIVPTGATTLLPGDRAIATAPRRAGNTELLTVWATGQGRRAGR
jgi:hypothetical protein